MVDCAYRHQCLIREIKIMKSSLSLLLLAGILCTAPSIWADSISFNHADSTEFAHGFILKDASWHGTGDFGSGSDDRWNADFEGAFSPEDAAINCSVIDQSFDFPQSNSSKEHQLSFVPKWGPDHGWDGGYPGDSYWAGWGDHDGDKGDHWGPTVPTPEPDSFWLLLAGMAVVGLCSLLRRTMPRILS